MLFTNLALCLAPLSPQGFELVADINVQDSLALSGMSGSSGFPYGVPLGGRVLYEGASPTLGHELFQTDVGQPLSLVKDINPGPASSFPGAPAELGGKLYFAADHASFGREIWTTDGTAIGTVLWADLTPGGASAAPEVHVAAAGGVVFSALDQAQIRQLFWSDGNPANITQLTAKTVFDGFSTFESFHASSGHFFFVTSTLAAGQEVWVSDGTAGGTQLLADISAGAEDTLVREFIEFGGATYFSAASWINGDRSLWRTDGTSAGTTSFVQIGFPGADTGDLLSFGGKLLFTAYDAVNGAEIWETDGTLAGTQVLTDLTPAGVSSAAQSLFAFGGQVLFTVPDQAPQSEGVYRLSAGPLGATLLLAAQVTGVNAGWEWAEHAGRAYFRTNAAGSGLELWSTDGTSAGTSLVADIEPGLGFSSPADFVSTPSGLLFVAQTTASGRELYQHAAGTTSLHTDLNPLVQNGNSNPDVVTTVFARDVYLGASEGTNGTEPFKWTPGGGLVALGDLNPGSASSTPREFTGVVQAGVGRVFFTAVPANGQRDLFVHDANGTALVGLRGAVISSEPQQLAGYRDNLLFVADNMNGANELFMTDGTLAGTLQLSLGSSAPGTQPGNLTVVGADIYYTGISNGNRRDLFVSNGAASTQLTDHQQAGPRAVQRLTHVRGRLVYLLPTAGASPYAIVVRDPVTGAETAYPQASTFSANLDLYALPEHLLEARGSRFYFEAFDTALGNILGSLDINTGVQTLLGSSAMQADAPSNIKELTWIGPFGYFSGDGAKGRELYRITNAPLSAQLVYNAQGPNGFSIGSASPRDLTAIGNDLYFAQTKTDIIDQTGDLLTTSGGLVTTAADLTHLGSNPAAYSGNVDNLSAAAGHLFFVAYQHQSVGRELFRVPFPGAHVVDFGTNGASGTLEIDTPLLGSNVGFYLRNALPGTLATVWISGLPAGPTPGLASAGDTLWLNPATAQLYSMTASTELLTAYPVPSAPALTNAQVVLQGVMVDPLDTSALRTTNAKLVTLGL